MSKYFSKKVFLDGIKFDSKKESERWIFLKNEEQNGNISELKRQVKFELVPSQKIDGKVVERPLTYIADFTYIKDGQLHVEDVKPKDKNGKIPTHYRGTSAFKEYVVKRKLMLYLKHIKIKKMYCKATIIPIQKRDLNMKTKQG